MTSSGGLEAKGGGNVMISKSKCGYPETATKDETIWCKKGSFVDGWTGETSDELGLTNVQIRCS